MMKKNFKKAFTLTEIIIVLAVVGLITFAVMYVAQESMPNPEIVKLKNVHSLLGNLFQGLPDAEKYYKDSDLGILPTGGYVNKTNYLCKSMVAYLTTRDVNCNNATTGTFDSTALLSISDSTSSTIDGRDIGEIIDCVCRNNVPATPDMVLADGTSLYIVNPYYHFGSMANTMLPSSQSNRMFNKKSSEKRYKYLCVDIDGLNSGEDPFGYGLRVDGKLILGKRTSLWLNAKTTDKKVEGDTYTCSSTPVPTPDREPEPTEDDENPCPDKTILITAESGNFCMMQYNAGDADYNGIESIVPTTIAIYESESTPCALDNGQCCWKSSYTCNSEGSYKTSNRIVCNWQAANAYCSLATHGMKTWKLPSGAQLNAIKSNGNYYSKGLGDGGLMLCDIPSASKNDSSMPEYIWGDIVSDDPSGGYHYYAHLESNNFIVSHTYGAYKASVRCVAPAD